MKIWKTKEGKKIPYKKLDNEHLKNILKFIRRRAKEGVIMMQSGFLPPMLFDWEEEVPIVYIIRGKEVLEQMDYKGLEKEAKKRKLI